MSLRQISLIRRRHKSRDYLPIDLFNIVHFSSICFPRLLVLSRIYISRFYLLIQSISSKQSQRERDRFYFVFVPLIRIPLPPEAQSPHFYFHCLSKLIFILFQNVFPLSFKMLKSVISFTYNILNVNCTSYDMLIQTH